MTRPLRALFVTWDGAAQDYVRSLYLPMFVALRRHGVEIDLLQMLRGPRERAASVAQSCIAAGIDAESLAIERKADLPLAIARARTRIARAHPYDLVIPRSIVPAALTQSVPSAAHRMVFEADGLSADERVENAGWSDAGIGYAAYREIEARAVRRARLVLTRTHRAAEILRARGGPAVPDDRIVVVPNGIDAARFENPAGSRRLELRARHGIASDALVAIYCGSLGPQYLPESLWAIAAELRAREPGSLLLVVTGQPDAVPVVVRERLGPSLKVLTARPDEVPELLALADVGLALRARSFSQQAVSPIKVGEYLLSGLPVVASFVGDLREQIGGTPVALDFDGDPRTATDWIVACARRDELRERARALGERRFGLDHVAACYAAALTHASGAG